MFETLVFQYLNKRSESKVRNFASPEAFHTLKVQGLSDDSIKPSAEVCGKFEMPISALVGDMSVEPSELTDSTPPIVRTFNFTRKVFVEFSEIGQGLLQELRGLYLLTGVECQIRVHTEVHPTLSPVAGNTSLEVSSVTT